MGNRRSNNAVDLKEKAIKNIKNKDLPLCCPMLKDSLWNMHPRVYLPLDANNEAMCPYCSQKYKLIS